MTRLRATFFCESTVRRAAGGGRTQGRAGAFCRGRPQPSRALAFGRRRLGRSRRGGHDRAAGRAERGRGGQPRRRMGRELEANLDRYDRSYQARSRPPRRLAGGGASGLHRSARRQPRRLRLGAGARGLKVWKDLGLRVRDYRIFILPDDDRLGPLWTPRAGWARPSSSTPPTPWPSSIRWTIATSGWEELLENPDWSFTPTAPHLRV